MKMTRTHFLAGLAMAVGLLVSGGAPAKAQNLDVNVGPSNFRASGTYRVVINRTAGNTFSVQVTGNNDGRMTTTDPLNAPIKHGVEQVSVGFLRQNGTFIQAAGGFGGTSVPWTPTFANNTQQWQAPGLFAEVQPFGGNSFNGQTNLVGLGPNEQVAAFAITLQDGNQQWFGQFPVSTSVIPEPGSLALVLPGLMPLGLMLLRRRSLRNGTPEAEETAPQEA